VDLHSHQRSFEMFVDFLNAQTTDIIFALTVFTIINLILTIGALVRDARIGKKIEWLERTRRRLGGASERRFLRDLQDKPVARLLLEGPRFATNAADAKLNPSTPEHAAKTP
jgi:hypothetical protein